MRFVAGGKQWEDCGWTGAEWHSCDKLLELGPEAAGQFCAIALIDRIKRDRV